MAKTAKTNNKSANAGKATRKHRVTRPQVVSFRITRTQAKTLSEIYDRDPITGVSSPNRLARKIVCDFLAGRLEYRDPADKTQDLDVVGA